MAAVSEIEAEISELPPKEERYFKLKSYQRDGTIPGWSEVVGKFELRRFHPRDFRLLRGYYKAQRRIAEGRNKKAQRIFNGLDNNPDFVALEENSTALLNDIASFVRGKGK